MKSLRLALSLAVLFGLTGVANAYKIVVLDPPPGSFTIDDIGSTPFNATFTPCATGQIPGQRNPNAGELCFSGESIFESDIKSLELVLPETALNNLAANCSSPIFTSQTCSIIGGQYVLDFTGGLITPGEIFTITIEAEKGDPALSPTNFPPAVSNAALAPEPSSMLLLSTGLASMGVGTLRRKWLGSSNTSS